ncbi:MAG TPA: tetratricopeptide repeat protein, partial [Bryobacteraceae bacterium]
ERGARELRTLLFDQADFAADRLQPGIARYHLSHYLMQMMMRALRRATDGGRDEALDLGQAPVDSWPVDRDFLELLTLSFVVLHEIGHITLGHNRPGYRGADAEVAMADRLIEQLRNTEGVENIVEFSGTQSSFELEADVFAVHVLVAEFREPMLEAASLWCAAMHRAHLVSSGDRVDDLEQMSQAPEAHPSHAVRVWYLNGQLASGRRAGPIARRIREAAESTGLELQLEDAAPVPASVESAVFAGLWELVAAATADSSGWEAPPHTEAMRTPESPEHAALLAGIQAWGAGDGGRAHELLRMAVRSTDPKVSGQAHGLLGRLMEDQGDVTAAEAEYRLGDELGDGDSANDLGTLLKDRGELQEAIGLFERADERGNAPGPFNLGLIAEERGNRAAAIVYFRRADQRGHAQAALNLGILSYHAGELDVAEAALRRAEIRQAENAPTYLGIVLHDRGDQVATEAALRRGAARGELDALHSLGVLLEEEGRLHEAAEAYEEAVKRGRHGSFGNLRYIAGKLSETEDSKLLMTDPSQDDAEAAYRRGFALAHRHQAEAAAEAWRNAESLGHRLAANELGLVLHAQGDIAGAEAAYRRGAENGHARAIYNLGVLLHERGDEEGAEAAWQKADALGDALAATNLGSALESTGCVNLAQDAYRRAGERGDALGLVRLGSLLERRDKLDRAEAAYRRAVELGDGIASAALGRLLLARGDVNAAEAEWRRGDLRGNGDASLQLGLLLRRLGKLDAAEAALRRALERGRPRALRHLAFLLSQEGYQDDALRAATMPAGAAAATP